MGAGNSEYPPPTSILAMSDDTTITNEETELLSIALAEDTPNKKRRQAFLRLVEIAKEADKKAKEVIRIAEEEEERISKL